MKPGIINTINILEDLNRYLKGTLSKSQFHEVNSQYHKQDSLKKDFRRVFINDNNCVEGKGKHSVQSIVNELMTNLGLSDNEKKRYQNVQLSVYDFFEELKLTFQKKGFQHKKLNYFLQIIKKEEKKKRNRLIMMGVLFFLGAINLIPLVFTNSATILQLLASLSSFYPLLGIALTATVSLFSFYQITQNKQLSFKEKFIDNLFLMGKLAFNLAAYGVLIAAAATSNPAAGFFFVAATIVPVIRDSIYLFNIDRKIRQSGTILPSDNLAARQQKTRLFQAKNRLARSVAIDLISSVAMVAIMTAWCFAPVGGGIWVTVGALAAMGGVSAIQAVAKFANDILSKSWLLYQFDLTEHAYLKKHRRGAVNGSDNSDSPEEEPFHKIGSRFFQAKPVHNSDDELLSELTLSPSQSG